eukprot:TRINITY_DN76659_c0_g1_i1.p1 TRINITY_DN76659_c0_g1~~TRINITY_DN76659_c0_g1_i1.p1  ORF type:complete len:278 (+),score=36.38 TRINITY_DN76659_c0_g1_i1:360-1193(+)
MQVVAPSHNFPEELTLLESTLRTREPGQRQSSHCERWGNTGLLANDEAAKRRSMECHSYGSVHSVGPEHPETLDFLHQLANTLERRGRLAEAEEVMRHTMNGRLKAFGNHGGMADLSRRRLRELLIRQGHVEEAKELAEQIEHPGFVQRNTFRGNADRGRALRETSVPEVWKPEKRPPTTLREFGEIVKEADALRGEELMRRSQTARQKLIKGGQNLMNFTEKKYGRSKLTRSISSSLWEGQSTEDVSSVLREATLQREPSSTSLLPIMRRQSEPRL